MSRIGRKPILIPDQGQVKIEGQKVTSTGPKGSTERLLPEEIKAELKDGQVLVSINKETDRSKAFWGLFRSLLANDIEGVVNGFQKELELVGVGYRARMEGSDLVLELGFSHDVKIKPEPEIEFQVVGNNRVVISGIHKDKIGQVAHAIRKIRPPEPYKGKGVRYVGEQVRRKEGKKSVAGK
jgi:large subunit ribosomal protein L6